MPTKWNASDIGDLTGRTILVTGANSGIGLEASRQFLGHGANVVLAVRNLDKGAAAKAEISGPSSVDRVTILQLDLGSLASIRTAAATFLADHGRLDILVNNAGIMMTPEGVTADGFELQLGTNHLGHFALTGLLLDALLATPDARVVTIASLAHENGTMNFDNLMFEHGGYSPMAAYGRSKLANLLFAYELQRRLTAHGSTMKSVAAHPGLAATNLGDHFFQRWYLRPAKPVLSALIQGPDKGALPTLRAATDPTVTGGEYFGPTGFKGYGGEPAVVTSNAASHSIGDATQLWDRSVALTGVDYGAFDGRTS
jgi:NAD(P)-dependent dehydrogenase (short-subunit alcohol dehydrogenase family)